MEPKAVRDKMRMFPRRNSLRGFGLVDTFVGLLIVTVAAVAFSQAFQTVDRVAQRQETRVQALLEVADGSVLESSL